jgi:diguanylate cyclase (GGDEF)-like protein
MDIRDENELTGIRFGALLHDIGKIAIPEFILNKPTALTEAEFEKMKIHPAIGAEMLKGIEFPFPVQPLVKSHHERWDGKGYPEGLAGEAIPLGARILSAVDCYDALTTNRPYRAPMPRDEVLAFFRREAGRAYDPAVVEALVQNIESVEEEGRNIPEPTLDIWGSQAAQPIASPTLRPLERVHPAATFAKAMQVDSDTQRQLYSLFEFARNARCLSRSDILSFMATKLEALVAFDTGVFYLVMPDQGLMFPELVIGRERATFPADVRLSLDQKLSGWVAANNQAITNLPPTPDFESLSEKPQFAISAIAPMVHGGRVFGAISLYRTEKDKFSDTECRHLEIIAAQTSAALDRIPHDGSIHAALFDELTNLPNGYQLFLMFDQVAIDSVRYEYPLSLLAYRLENLADVRRKFGHISADALLRFVSVHLSNQVRESDILVRYAEDLFLSLHPRMAREQAEALKARVQEEFDRGRVMLRDGVNVPIRVSAGIAEYPTDGKDMPDLLGIIDWQLSEDRRTRDEHNKLQFPSQNTRL